MNDKIIHLRFKKKKTEVAYDMTLLQIRRFVHDSR